MSVRWNIRNRLLASSALVGACVLVAVVGWGYFSVRHSAVQFTRDRALFVAESASAVLDGYLLRQQGRIEGVAFGLMARGLNLTQAQSREIIETVLREDPEIFGVCIALDPDFPLPDGWTAGGRAPYAFREKSGEIVFRDISGDGSGHAGENWFQLVKERDAAVWTKPYWWDGVLMVTYSYPLRVWDNGTRRFAGVVTCDLTLDWLDKKLADLPVGTDGYALLMDRSGLFVSHPIRELVLAKNFFEIARERGSDEMRALGERMVAGGRGVEEHTSYVTGKRGWIAYLPIASTDWIFVAVVSHDSLNRRLAGIAWQQAGIALAGLVLLAAALALVARSITRPIEQLTAASRALADGHLDAKLPAGGGGDEVADLARCMETMRQEIRRRMLEIAESTAVRERMESELRIAHDIQMSLVPKTFPPMPERPDVDLHAALLPAREVGGDFYDFFPTASGCLAVIIADVADKGVPAALYMAATRILLRSLFQSDADPDAGKILGTLNRALATDNPTGMFVTLFCGILDPVDGSFAFANAGHNPPLLVREDGSVVWINEGRRPAAGAIANVRFATETMTVRRGEYLVLYTDGITEAENGRGGFFGEDALGEVVRREAGRGVSCEKMIAEILAGVARFAGDAPVSDDRTLLVVRRKHPDDRPGGHPGEPLWQCEIPKRTEDVGRALDGMERALETGGCGPDILFASRLVLEELATNSCKADRSGGTHKMSVAVHLHPAPMMVFCDECSAFDPLGDAPGFDPSAPLDARSPGGVGLHLIRSFAEDITSRREDDGMRIAVTFKTGATRP
jgi:sigma-B regulation protein RsbU (phosphoserine phosphatase)